MTRTLTARFWNTWRISDDKPRSRVRRRHVLETALAGYPDVVGLTEVHLGARKALEATAEEKEYVLVASSQGCWEALGNPTPHTVMLIRKHLHPGEGRVDYTTGASKDGEVLRTAMAAASVLVNGRRITVATVYTPADENKVDNHSAMVWADEFSERTDGDLVVGGDWNNWASGMSSWPLATAGRNGWVEVQPEEDKKTHSYDPTKTACQRIDHVFSRLPAGTLASCRIIEPPVTQWDAPMCKPVSDHAMLEAVFDFGCCQSV